MERPVEPYPPPTVRESKDAAASAAVKEVALAKSTVALLIVAVPVVAPRESVVAAPPIFTVVAPVLNTEAVVDVVVRSPSVISASPDVTIPEVVTAK